MLVRVFATGEVKDLPDDDAIALIEAGAARPVKVGEHHERATLAPDCETPEPDER